MDTVILLPEDFDPYVFDCLLAIAIALNMLVEYINKDIIKFNNPTQCIGRHLITVFIDVYCEMWTPNLCQFGFLAATKKYVFVNDLIRPKDIQSSITLPNVLAGIFSQFTLKSAKLYITPQTTQ